MCFLFRLDLNIYVGAGFFFGILVYATKHGPKARHLQVSMAVRTALLSAGKKQLPIGNTQIIKIS